MPRKQTGSPLREKNTTSFAKVPLGWKPRATFKELVREMTQEDLKAAERDALISEHGYVTYSYHEQ
jgi:GDPmannose 4,6-dehydratase